MEFTQIAQARHAAKSFDGRMVDEKTLDKLLDLIRLAPSSYNFQPWRIKVIADAATKQALLPHSYHQPQITSCSHLLVLCADTDLESRARSLYALMRASRTPEAKVAETARTRDGFIANLQGAHRLCYAQHQAYLALAYALLGAQSLGLDACPMGGFSPSEYSRILRLPAHLVPTVLCPLGYAAGKPQPKIRFENKDVFF